MNSVTNYSLVTCLDNKQIKILSRTIPKIPRLPGLLTR